jgi:hypothetical protein
VRGCFAPLDIRVGNPVLFVCCGYNVCVLCVVEKRREDGI